MTAQFDGWTFTVPFIGRRAIFISNAGRLSKSSVEETGLTATAAALLFTANIAPVCLYATSTNDVLIEGIPWY